MKQILIHIAFTFFMFTTTFSQSNMSIKASSIGYTFSTNNSELFSNIISTNIPVEPGLVFNYDYFISDDKLSLSFNQIIFLDRASKITGLTGFCFRQKIFNYYKHSMHIYLGASVYYRQTWADFPNYSDSENLIQSDKIEYKPFSPIAGFEYAYLLNQTTDFLISIDYFQYKTINIDFGIRYWINKKIRNNRKCISCPLFH